MKKDEFWSVEKLLPRVKSSFRSPYTESFPNKNCGVSVSNLSKSPEEQVFGEKIYPKSSRVIRYFQLSRFQSDIDDRDSENRDFLFTIQNQKPDLNLSFVPCPLFSPSFSKMSDKQLSYYVLFREKVKLRIKLKIDFSYLLLYCYEKIQLAREIGIDSIFNDFIWLWETYRSDFSLTDKLFCDLLSDLSFYCNTAVPYDRISDLISSTRLSVKPFLYSTYIFDYLFSKGHTMSDSEIEFVLANLTKHGFRGSKAYQTNRRFSFLCEKCVYTAFRSGLLNAVPLNEALLNLQIPSEVKIHRRIFSSIPLDRQTRENITIVYTPLLHDENILSRCEELVRYIENRVRAALKMKNCLSRVNIAQPHRLFIEQIITALLQNIPAKTELSEQAPPKAEHKLEVDFAAANEIEQESRLITKELTQELLQNEADFVLLGGDRDDDFDKAYQAELKSIEPTMKGCGSAEAFWEFAALLDENEEQLVSLLLYSGVEKAREFAFSKGIFFESMLASCNQKAQSAIEDIVFDANGKVYDDYISEMKNVFTPMEGKK